MPGVGSKVTSLSWIVAGGLAGWAAARVMAIDRVRRAETAAVPVLTFTPQVAAAAPWVALGLRLARRRGPAATAAVAATALGLAVRPRRVPRPQPGATGPRLRVLTANLYFGRGDAEVVVSRVRQGSVDVLFLQELTADAVTRLKQAGLDDLMPHTQIDLRGGSRGSGIYSRFPLTEGLAMAPTHMAQPTARLELPSGDTVELVCVHPSPRSWAAAAASRGARSWGRCRRRASCPGCWRGTSTPPSIMPRSATSWASATPTPGVRRGRR